MSIYLKLANARAAFHGRELKKSGHNKFAGYRYFELADFVVPGMECLAAEGLVPVISFDAEQATMTLHETDGDGTITITSPMSSAALKGCHDVQNLGAVQTYLRRYLWTAALEIIEHDALDSSPPAEQPKKAPAKHVKAIQAMVEETGADLPKMLKFFKVKALDELTSEQAEKAVALLEKKRAA